MLQSESQQNTVNINVKSSPVSPLVENPQQQVSINNIHSQNGDYHTKQQQRTSFTSAELLNSNSVGNDVISHNSTMIISGTDRGFTVAGAPTAIVITTIGMTLPNALSNSNNLNSTAIILNSPTSVMMSSKNGDVISHDAKNGGKGKKANDASPYQQTLRNIAPAPVIPLSKGPQRVLFAQNAPLNLSLKNGPSIIQLPTGQTIYHQPIVSSVLNNSINSTSPTSDNSSSLPQGKFVVVPAGFLANDQLSLQTSSNGNAKNHLVTTPISSLILPSPNSLPVSIASRQTKQIKQEPISGNSSTSSSGTSALSFNHQTNYNVNYNIATDHVSSPSHHFKIKTESDVNEYHMRGTPQENVINRTGRGTTIIVPSSLSSTDDHHHSYRRSDGFSSSSSHHHPHHHLSRSQQLSNDPGVVINAAVGTNFITTSDHLSTILSTNDNSSTLHQRDHDNANFSSYNQQHHYSSSSSSSSTLQQQQQYRHHAFNDHIDGYLGLSSSATAGTYANTSRQQHHQHQNHPLGLSNSLSSSSPMQHQHQQQQHRHHQKHHGGTKHRTYAVENTSKRRHSNTLNWPIGPGGKPRKPCNCTKSMCLKLYCDCFAAGEFCQNCNCVNCYNNVSHEDQRQRAIKQTLDRNPLAFHPKIGTNDRGVEGESTGERVHQKGCHCKRSGCLKNYCECYEAKIMCSTHCKCVGCKNQQDYYDSRSSVGRRNRMAAGLGVAANRYHRKNNSAIPSSHKTNSMDIGGFSSLFAPDSGLGYDSMGSDGGSDSNSTLRGATAHLFTSGSSTQQNTQQTGDINNGSNTSVKNNKISSSTSRTSSNNPSPSTIERMPALFVTDEVVEATGSCLLAQAEESERISFDKITQQKHVIQEFGRCIVQIIEAAQRCKSITLSQSKIQ